MISSLDLNQIPRAETDQCEGAQVQALLAELEMTRALCRKLEQIIEYAPDGICVTDSEANTIRINSAYEHISGMKGPEVLGRNHRDLEREGLISRSCALMALQQCKPVTILHEYSATKCQALVTSIPVFDSDGAITLVVSGTRNLEELNDLKAKRVTEREVRLKHECQLKVIENKAVDTRGMVAVDQKTLSMISAAHRVSLVDSTVLITGETGVGKEEVAKYIHEHSARSKAPFVVVNCGAIPGNLVESELFGYEKGSFTGALHEGKTGLLEVANRGTLFLDEVGELPMDVQVKLLRVLESRSITHIGGSTPIAIDVRVISATHRNLMQMVKEQKFREDLYYRLRVVPIHIPALRDRVDDIIPLINHFLQHFNQKYGFEKTFSYIAYRALLEYEWPGNIRELKNVIEHAVVMTEAETITEEGLPVQQANPWGAPPTHDPQPLKERLERMEYLCMMESYTTHASVRKAAAALEMTVPTFIRKRQKYEVKYPLHK